MKRLPPTFSRLNELYEYNREAQTLVNRTSGENELIRKSVRKIDGRHVSTLQLLYTMHYGEWPKHALTVCDPSLPLTIGNIMRYESAKHNNFRLRT